MKFLTAVFCIAMLNSGIKAQSDWSLQGIPTIDRMYFGGGLGGGLSNTYAYAEISPLVGYRLNVPFSVGLQVTYQYFQDKIYSYDSHTYGFRPFGRAQLFDFLFLHAEFERLWLKARQEINNQIYFNRVGASGVLGGIGYSSSGFSNSSFYIMALYYARLSDYSPYRSPIIFRAGFTIGR